MYQNFPSAANESQFHLLFDKANSICMMDSQKNIKSFTLLVCVNIQRTVLLIRTECQHYRPRDTPISPLLDEKYFANIGRNRSQVHFRFNMHKKKCTGINIIGQWNSTPVSRILSYAICKNIYMIIGYKNTRIAIHVTQNDTDTTSVIMG